MRKLIFVLAVLTCLVVPFASAQKLPYKGALYTSQSVPISFLGKREGRSVNGQYKYNSYMTFTADGYGLSVYSNGKASRFQWGFMERAGRLYVVPSDWPVKRFRSCYLVYVKNPNSPIRTQRHVTGAYCPQTDYFWYGRGLFTK